MATLFLVLGTVPAPLKAQAQDSVELRIRAALERLGREPAPDTVTLPLDTAGERPSARRAGGSAGDSVVAALLGLGGYEATGYEGLAADFDATDRVLVLHGDSVQRAAITARGSELTADSVIRYHERTRRLDAVGRPVYTPAAGDEVQSEHVIVDFEQQRGTALGARTHYREGADWYMTGDLPSVSAETVYGAETHFTSCDLDVPHYHFRAKEVKIVAGRILVARPVKLYFGDVPVAWLPFIAQGLGSGRASGLLMPSFSVNDIVRTSGRYRRRVSNIGFYWAMSDYADATVALDWFSDNFTALTGRLRYAWARQFLEGSVNVRRYWEHDGSRQFAFDTDHSWQMDERTSLRLAARYSSSNEFLRRNSFDPREVTQSINSTGGFDRRFDWGNISLSGNRDQYLSDDRVRMTLPQVQLNLSTITLFRAPPARASWWNNLTWSGGASGSRRTIDRAREVGGPVTAANADTEDIDSRIRSSFNVGNLSWSQRLSIQRSSVFQIPMRPAESEALGLSPSGRLLVPSAHSTTGAATTLGDVARTDLDWQTSIGYQQQLIGSTTLTPSLSLQGTARQSDTLDIARDRFVSSPTRVTVGASLKSDLFGFFPGVGPFEAIRHKLSPSFQFSYAPAVTSTDLQQQVFGRREIRPRKELSLTLTQTFEAKRRASTADTADAEQDGPAAGDTTVDPDAPRPMPPRPDIVTLLALRTSAVQYDFVEADERGDPLFGFQTTRINSQVSSDFLRGLSISMSHDLFADTVVRLANGETHRERRFDFRLADLNLGFSLDNDSGLWRALGLAGGEEADTAEPADTAQVEADELEENPFLLDDMLASESMIIPGQDRGAFGGARLRGGDQPVGTWRANLSYSLARPRDSRRAASQMLSGTVELTPTERWQVSWRTSYDLERGGFNDHMIRVTRDIHDWEANFDFSQTAVGNWAFRFEVALKANQDLHFNYKQQNNARRPGLR